MRRRFATLAVAVLLGIAVEALAQGGAAPADSTRKGAPRPARPNGFVPADSLPSSDAEGVLRSIPDPVPASERVEPPARDSLAAAPDSAAADSSGVPVPSPTAPLGDAPGSLTRMPPPDTLRAAPPPAWTAQVPDTCWRLQLAAAADREEAEAKRAAAESQLMVPMAIEIESGLHKVRTRDCLTRQVVDALRSRALDSGFADAFRIRMTEKGAVAGSAPAAKPAARKSAPAKPRSKR